MPAGGAFRAEVQVRYHHEPVPATVSVAGSEARGRASTQPELAVTPGQGAALLPTASGCSAAAGSRAPSAATRLGPSRSLAPRDPSGGARAGRLALAGAGSLALGALLAVAGGLGLESQRPLELVLVDTSASAVRTRSGYAAWIQERVAAHAARARGAGRDLALVRCGEFAELLWGPRPASEARAAVESAVRAVRTTGPGAPGDLATDLAGALALAEELLAQRPAGGLVLLGDGTFTGADPGPAFARLAERGVACALERPPEPDLADVALAGVRLPRALAPGAPLAVEVALESRGAALGGARVDLELVLDGPGFAEPERRSATGLALAGASSVQRFELGPARPGRTEVCAAVKLHGPGGVGDPVPENDAACTAAHAGEALIAAALAPEGLEPALRSDWDAWCTALAGLGGIQVLRAAPAEFAALSGAVDVAITCDVPVASAAALGLEDFVAAGGGWLALGGYRLFAGGPAEIAPLLPVAGPSRSILFLADGSGSMAGAPSAELARAVLGAMEVAPASDRFELCFFGDAIRSRHALGPGGPDTARAAAELFAARAPHGATDIAAVLRALAAEASLPDLVVLVSDGRDQVLDELARAAQELRARLQSSRGRLAIAGVGQRDDSALALLAEDGAARAEGDLAAIFREEVELGRVTPRGAHAVLARDPAGLAPGGLGAELAAALGSMPLAALERVLSARAAPGAEVVLDAPAIGPVLAVRRHGRGRVAAFASAPVLGFGGAWTARPELLAPVVRALGRGPSQRGLELGLAPGRGGLARLAGVPPDWPAALHVPAGANRSEAIVFAPPPEVPGADPRTFRDGRAPARRARPLATFHAGAPRDGTARDGTGGVEPGELLASLPWPGAGSEFTPQVLGPLPAPGSGGAADPGPGGGHPLAPWLVGVGLACVALAATLGWDALPRAAPGIGRVRR